MGGDCFMGHISKTGDPATVVAPAPASNSSPPAENNGGEAEMTATTTTRKRRRTDGPSSSSPSSSGGGGGGNPTTNSIIQDALFVEAPPQGVSRVEHLLGNMAASASPVMTRPAPSHVANPGFMTAMATTGAGRAANELLSRSGGVDASWQFGNHSINDGIVVDQRADQQQAISRDLPTHLPFRRALQPVLAAPQPAWGPAGGMNGFVGAQQPQQQPQQQPSLDVNPFGIMEQDVVDVDALLTSMGHGTVVGMVDGNEGSGSIYPGSTAGMSMDGMLGNDFPMAMDNAGTAGGAGTSSGRVRAVEEQQQQQQQQEQQQSTTRSESHPWAMLNLPTTTNDGQLAGMGFGNMHR